MLERRAGRVGLSAAAAESGVQGWRAPVEGAAGWRRGGQEERARARRARQRRKEGERRGKGERKERKGGKEKRKKMGKRKRKRKRRGKRREKERGREVRAGITALIAEPVGHAWRPDARERDAQVEGKQGAGYGCRVFGESGVPAEQGGFRKTGVRVQGGISSSTTKQNFSARFILDNFRDVTNLPHLK